MQLHSGLPLRAFAFRRTKIDKELDLLVRRLARHGLLEYRFGRSPNGADQVVIEPQVADYWPRTPQLSDADVLVLSRFAYMRRRGNEMVLESPRAGALFKICDPKLAAAIALLSTPQKIKQLGEQDAFPGNEFLALLVDCQILFKVDAGGSGLRPTRVMTTWFFGTFTISCSTPAARKADTPILWAGCFRMPMLYRRYRRCGLVGLERKSICASFRRRIRRQSRRSQNSCGNVIRPEASMISGRSRSPSFRGFSTAPHAWQSKC